MWILVHKDLTQMKSQLLQIFGLMAVMLAIVGRMSQAFSMSLLATYPIVLSMNLPQMSLGAEERGNMLLFLRSLPVRPRTIVGSKYLVAVAVFAVFMILLALAGLIGILPVNTVITAMTVVSLVSLVLSALSHFLHFWLGANKARVALLIVSGTMIGITALVVGSGQSTSTVESISSKLAHLAPLAGSLKGVGLSFAVGLSILFISYLGSVWIFSRRDLSDLP